MNGNSSLCNVGYTGNFSRLIKAGTEKLREMCIRDRPYLPDLENGLTPTGIAFVEEMERLGIVTVSYTHLVV